MRYGKLMLAAFIILSLTALPLSEAHILIVADSLSDSSCMYEEAKKVATTLKNRGYQVVELYKGNATVKNILKGMYGADAVIYAGHGGYMSGNYDCRGGYASPPFSLVASDGYIWGAGDMVQVNGQTFYLPFKEGIPVILLHACFSTGWVEDYEVKNPIETIYHFSRMFTGSGANYYATAWDGAEIIYDFLNGSRNFYEANQKNFEVINKSTVYNGTKIWRNDHGYAAFVGDWNGTFPGASNTTPYDDAAAEEWYRTKVKPNFTGSKPVADFTYTYCGSTSLRAFTFRSTAYDPDNDTITLKWNFGDGSTAACEEVTHTYAREGYYTVSLTATDSNGLISVKKKTITVGNPKPDLVVTGTRKSGSTLYIYVKNQGTAAARNFYTRVWYGSYSTKNYKQVYTGTLNPGATVTLKTYYRYSRGTVKVDYYNRVSEKSETNNIRKF